MLRLRHPFPRWLGLSWLGWLNFLVFQWAGFRLTAETAPRDSMVAEADRGIVMAWGWVTAWPLTRWAWLGQRPCSSPISVVLLNRVDLWAYHWDEDSRQFRLVEA